MSFFISVIIWAMLFIVGSMIFIALGVNPSLAVQLGIVVSLFIMGPLTWFFEWISNSTSGCRYIRRHK
jgi:hypothetical protein